MLILQQGRSFEVLNGRIFGSPTKYLVHSPSKRYASGLGNAETDPDIGNQAKHGIYYARKSGELDYFLLKALSTYYVTQPTEASNRRVMAAITI
jgi:hypothetical protein